MFFAAKKSAVSMEENNSFEREIHKFSQERIYPLLIFYICPLSVQEMEELGN